MNELKFTEGRNGVKLPKFNFAERSTQDLRGGSYLARGFFYNFWKVNNLDIAPTDNHFQEIVIPESDTKPLIIFRSLYVARQFNDINRDYAIESKRRPYRQLPITIGSRTQSVLTTPEKGSMQWGTVLALQHSETRNTSNATDTDWDISDTLTSPIIDDNLEQQWTDLSISERQLEHRKAVRNLLDQIVDMAS